MCLSFSNGMDYCYTPTVNLTRQELLEVMACVRYYQNRHLSVNNPRHLEFDAISKKLNISLQSKYDRDD